MQVRILDYCTCRIRVYCKTAFEDTNLQARTSAHDCTPNVLEVLVEVEGVKIDGDEQFVFGLETLCRSVGRIGCAWSLVHVELVLIVT